MKVKEEKYISSEEEYLANRRSYPLYQEIDISTFPDMEFETTNRDMAIESLTYFANQKIDEILNDAGDLLVPGKEITYKITTTEMIYEGYRQVLLVGYHVYETKENYDSHVHYRMRSDEFADSMLRKDAEMKARIKASKLNVTNAKKLLKEKGYKLVKE